MDADIGDAKSKAVTTFLAGISKFSSGALSDFTIVSGGRVWPVHLLVLSAHSLVLEKACTGGFKEASESRLDLSDHHPDCVDYFVHFLYHSHYDEVGCLGELSNPEMHVKMCIIADKYDMPHLQTMAIRKFKSCLERAKVDDIAEAASEAYDAPGPTEEIRTAIIQHGIEKGLLSSDATEGTLRKVMNLHSDFAVDYAKALELRLHRGWDDEGSKEGLFPDDLHMGENPFWRLKKAGASQQAESMPLSTSRVEG